ncbi:biotin carboxylase N-terminal domain-containing protein [Actinotalea sp. Marseille-Q4924]|uniref:ATP-binding protein n=1 Tax=Actinotalea sp. Marseille-Q4924 TaxID=2866571 RepID=UPI001CE47C22|nr:biotin carboxylase N-terminal domain-containing protein [Actinotalea sp. Marseille-Q4924]
MTTPSPVGPTGTRAAAAPARLFSTVLVANRGEIACRVIRTLRALGIRSVAVYSDADRDARHVALADEAVRLGPADARRSYLDVDAVLAAARATGAEAIHPGYGFLAENAAFARACAQSGVVFVGPGVRALEVMGDKIRSKRHVAQAGVPVLPGVSEPGLDDDALVAAAADVGFPLLVKPSAGGGGKGMEVVERAEDLPEALRTARRVAAAAFGDDTLLLERYVREPRHIEVQVLADTHGTVIHLGERECSLQRRHQKVVEEAPSPLLDEETRQRMGAVACAAAASVGYVGAGTVEMIVPADDPTAFFFLEMNTRLQVEHPVTEMVTGLDLVEQQLRVAAGERLAVRQEDVRLVGHAIEARLYAEDRSRGFLPGTGRVLALEEPVGDGVRVDSALLPGLTVSADYDPMLAKVIAWGADRDQALHRLDAALSRTTVLGVPTNIAFLRTLLADEDVRAGRLDTGLVERVLARTTDDVPRAGDAAGGAGRPLEHVAVVVAALEHDRRAGTGEGTAPGASPWRYDGWRAGEPVAVRSAFALTDGAVLDVAVRADPAAPSAASTVTVDDGPPVRAGLAHRDGPVATLELDGAVRHVRIATDGATTWVGVDGAAVAVRRLDRAERLADLLAAAAREDGGVAAPEIRSPMPGTVVATHVESGDHVTTGQPLLTVEAMKMEHRLAATSDGIVTLTARPADRVALDQVVATIAAHPHEGTQG